MCFPQKLSGKMPARAGNMPALPKTRLSTQTLPLSLASRTGNPHVLG
jgi:hypothetical protein